ncbi:peptidoglycan-binding protein [Streptomyces sp. NPDC021020]|uniref:peptidoglycan-binding protein n=1 Tax=Streptomyces sp. NPDC021020 TaxID=3365109 RepID=UPI0037ADB7BA
MSIHVPKKVTSLVVAGAATAALVGGLVAIAPTASAAISVEGPCNSSVKVAANSTGSILWAFPVYKESNGDSWTDCWMDFGSTGTGVKALQNDLNKCYHNSLAVDGSFGNATRSALAAAQRSAKITDDGEYGEITSKHLLHRRYTASTGAFKDCKSWE